MPSCRVLAAFSGVLVASLVAAPLLAQTVHTSGAPSPAPTAPTAPTPTPPMNTGDPLPPRKGQLPPAPPEPMGPCGRFTPEEKSFNFGKILSDHSVEHIFKFKNTGDAHLIITSATGSCHCTVPTLSKLDYAPGEEGEIKVIFDPKGKAAGPVQQRVTVVSNDPTGTTKTLMIEADVLTIVNIEPRLVAFNQIPKGESKTVDVFVTGRIPEFAVTGVTFEGKGEDLKYEIGPAAPVDVNGEKLYRSTIKLTYPKASVIGNFNRSMVITTNDKREKESKVSVLGEVVGDAEVKPMRVTMGLVARGAQFSNTAEIRSRSHQKFTIKGIKQNNTPGAINQPQLTFEAKPIDANGKSVSGPSDVYSIAVSGLAPNAEFRGVIDCDVQTDIPGEENVKLGVYLVVR